MEAEAAFIVALARSSVPYALRSSDYERKTDFPSEVIVDRNGFLVSDRGFATLPETVASTTNT